MGKATYQTIKLRRGKHNSPGEGACVMELASMLAGEPFSDHPRCVCPIIGVFLRTYNDTIDDKRRQDLYAYASKVVGSRGSDGVQRARAQRLYAWISHRRRQRWGRLARVADLAPRPALDMAGHQAVRSIRTHSDTTHAEVLALIDELLALGVDGDATPAAATRASPRPVEHPTVVPVPPARAH